MDYLIVFAEDSPESKVAHDLLPFFEDMIKEVARHVTEKGDSWKTMPLYDLELILSQHVSKWYIDNETDDKDQLVDLANLCAMVNIRKSILCADLRSKE